MLDIVKYTKTVERTESLVHTANGQIENLKNALKLVAASNDVLDQVKRSMFYGSEYNSDKLDAALMTLKSINLEEFTAENMTANVSDVEPASLDNMAPFRVIHGAVGTCTETGELASAMLDYLETGELDRVNMAEEVGDSLFYFVVLCQGLGVSFEECFEAMKKKLEKRYPTGFSSENALNRDLDTERSILEDNLS